MGIDTGRFEAWPEKMSMMRPMPRGMESETPEEMQS